MTREITYFIKDISESLQKISASLELLCDILTPDAPVERREVKGFGNFGVGADSKSATCRNSISPFDQF